MSSDKKGDKRSSFGDEKVKNDDNVKILELVDQDPVVEFAVGSGPERKYLVSEPDSRLPGLRTMKTKNEKILVLILGLITAAVRLRKLAWPNSVVFDEVHFGGFASKYIQGSFFFDVHPPLAKMLFAYVGQLCGFVGDFAFTSIGDEFPSTTPYVLMRLFSAVCGLFTVLLMYFTLRASGIRIWVAFLTTLCFAVENSYVTISRYILLDAPLIMFIATAVYAFKKYELYQSFTFNSFRYLLATGVALGFAASSKWVGLFTIAWVGILCALRLLMFVGDLSKPVCTTMKLAVSKLVFLLVVPFVLYMFFFYVHFQVLSNDSEGSAFYSPEFRSTLNGNTIPKNIQADVGFGSLVTIRHTGTTGGYLHSHAHAYETGSKQQQITLYGHIDTNNRWLIEDATKSGVTYRSFKNITDGTKIKLFHPDTQHRLHSHDHKPPVSIYSDWQKEVSGYGFEGFPGDGNDDWIVEIDKSKSKKGVAQERIVAIDTKFRLRHAYTGCHLFSHDTKLPKWGYEQQEVTCASSGQPYLTLWYIEDNVLPILPRNAKRTSYQPSSFWQKFVESNSRMWTINKGLTDSHFYQSAPGDWPLLQRGISYWGQHNRSVYLLGNAILWWTVSLSVVMFVGVVCWEVLFWHVGKPVLQSPIVLNFHIQTLEYILGFAVHYIPSFLMGRQLFLHHYLPAYYFGILVFGHFLDILVTYICRNRRRAGVILAVSFTLATIWFFYAYSPIIYGSEWTKAQCERSTWFPTWDYNCNGFPESYSEYATIATTTATETVEQTVAETAAAAA